MADPLLRAAAVLVALAGQADDSVSRDTLLGHAVALRDAYDGRKTNGTRPLAEPHEPDSSRSAPDTPGHGRHSPESSMPGDDHD